MTTTVFAQENNATPVPRGALLPLGALPNENPALFDVVTEPVQSIKGSSNPVFFSIILVALFVLFVFLFLKFKKHILPRRKMKS